MSLQHFFFGLDILPSDYKHSGNIMDDEILNNLIKAMPKGVYTTMLVDSCYSGTVGELPYILKSSATKQEIEKRANFDTDKASSVTSSGTKQKLKASRAEQTIELFYDLDTRKEALEKEQKGGEEYQIWKHARKLQRSWMHFEPGKLVEYVSDHSKYAAEMMAKAGTAGYEGVKVVGVTGYDGLKIAADYTAKGAYSGAAAVAKVSSDGAKLVSDGAVAAAKVSTEGAKRVSDGAMGAVSSVATVSSDGVKRVSDGAATAASSVAKISLDGAQRVSDGAMGAVSSSGKVLGSVANAATSTLLSSLGHKKSTDKSPK
jgi:chitodextrinase